MFSQLAMRSPRLKDITAAFAGLDRRCGLAGDDVDVYKRQEQGDVILLCSDGLTDLVSDEEIKDIQMCIRDSLEGVPVSDWDKAGCVAYYAVVADPDHVVDGLHMLFWAVFADSGWLVH